MARRLALLVSAAAVVGLALAGSPFTPPGNYTPPSFNYTTTPGGFVFNASTPAFNNGTGWNNTTPWPVYNASTPYNWNNTSPWGGNGTNQTFPTSPPFWLNGTSPSPNNTQPWYYNTTAPNGNFTWPPLNYTTTPYPYYNYSTTPYPGNTSFCPDGWIVSNSTWRTCYYNAFSAPVDYTAATQFCSVIQQGATIVTIESGFENTEIRELGSTPSFWLGLDRYHGSWQWANGGNTTYLHWQSGEPKADANCARANRQDGYWYGADCSVDLPVVCKLKY